MEITEVRIKLMEDPHERLQAFCSITFDYCFVIRDLKIIQGIKGSFVAMPSRKLTDRCPRCHAKNHLRALHCNQCGAKLDDERALRDNEGRARLYADIAHPINSECREMIQRCVVKAYQEELIRSKQPGYVCTYDDYGEDRYATLLDPDEEAALSESLVAEEGRRNGRTFRSTRDDRVHRVDPPHPNPQSPHTPQEAPVYAGSRESNQYVQTASGDDDTFGAGLV
jgi:stage V sporulation protein G